MFFGKKIPETERVSRGVSYKEMMKNIGAPFTIIATVLLLIMIASIPSVSVNFDSLIPYIVIGGIVVMVLFEAKTVNKISLLFPFVLFCMLLIVSSELGTT